MKSGIARKGRDEQVEWRRSEKTYGIPQRSADADEAIGLESQYYNKYDNCISFLVTYTAFKKLFNFSISVACSCSSEWIEIEAKSISDPAPGGDTCTIALMPPESAKLSTEQPSLTYLKLMYGLWLSFYFLPSLVSVSLCHLYSVCLFEGVLFAKSQVCAPDTSFYIPFYYTASPAPQGVQHRTRLRRIPTHPNLILLFLRSPLTATNRANEIDE